MKRYTVLYISRLNLRDYMLNVTLTSYTAFDRNKGSKIPSIGGFFLCNAHVNIHLRGIFDYIFYITHHVELNIYYEYICYIVH